MIQILLLIALLNLGSTPMGFVKGRDQLGDREYFPGDYLL
jgi:hypothetical protein